MTDWPSGILDYNSRPTSSEQMLDTEPSKQPVVAVCHLLATNSFQINQHVGMLVHETDESAKTLTPPPVMVQ